jgi:hypothetical protein
LGLGFGAKRARLLQRFVGHVDGNDGVAAQVLEELQQVRVRVRVRIRLGLGG